ncbi:MAG: hypothetical protein LBD21_04735 [Tannerellaceae bacterium]|jgi:hypothetical protein|nr:hypothetical protein [Tannerellaceae bacterium]
MKLFARWNSEDDWKAKEAVRKIDDQKKLARIAVEARRYDARIAAIEKLKAEDHQTLLAEIAKTEYGPVRKAAIKKLIAEDHQPTLAEIAKANVDYFELKAIVEKLTDQACIADVARNAKNREARIAAIEKLIAEEFQPLLAEIAKTDENSGFSKAAVEALTDQTCIADVACNARDRYVRKAAINKLIAEDHQPLLIEIAKTDMDSDVCKAAFKKILPTEHQPTLAEIAKAHVDYFELKAIVEKLTDQACIADVARNAKNRIARIAAIEKFTDQTCLADVARNARDGDVRRAAIKKLIAEEHQTLLAEIAKTDKDCDVRQAAVHRLIAEEHQPLLAEIAKTDKNEKVRAAAIKKLIAEDHQTLLAEIAKTDWNGDVCKAAIDKLTDKELLRQVIAHHGDVLKSGNEDKRRQSEQVLLHIYETQDNIELRKQIAAYNGTIIEEYIAERGHFEEDCYNHMCSSSEVYVIDEHARSERRFRVPVPN